MEWVLTHRVPRLIVPPIILLSLFAFLSTPLLQDLRRLSEDDISRIQPNLPVDQHEGNLIVNIKNINPNNGVATLDLTYVTEDIGQGKIELWAVSGGVTYEDGKLTYEVDAEMRRVPVVMESPSVFVWGNTKRATYKQQNAEIKIEKRNRGSFYPFDRYDIEFSFAVIDNNQKTLHPSIWCELNDPHFVHSRPRPLRTHGQKVVAVPNSLSVSLDRPTHQKIFLGISMVMGLGCVMWTLYKITYTSVDARDSLPLLAFDLTVLLAVPSLRGVFVPSNLQFAPLFDFFVVLIWTVGLMALCVNIVRHDIVIRIRKLATETGSTNSASQTVEVSNDRIALISGVSDVDFLTETATSRDIVGFDALHAGHHVNDHANHAGNFGSHRPRNSA